MKTTYHVEEDQYRNYTVKATHLMADSSGSITEDICTCTTLDNAQMIADSLNKESLPYEYSHKQELEGALSELRKALRI